MRIALGAIAVLVVAVGLLGWRLEVAGLRADAAEDRAASAEGLLADQVRQNGALLAGFDALDKALLDLGKTTAANNRDLANRLKDLKTITQTEGDTDATMACLGLPVPVQLDQRMR